MINFVPITYQPPSLHRCNGCQLPTPQRNYCIFDKQEVDYFVSQKENALPYLKNVLETSQNEGQITEVLYILNRMLDEKTPNIDKLYPTLAKYNNTNSANIQTFLAGIYRKTQIPDAFGPLIKMLIQNSIRQNPQPLAFDPNEEIGGAILSYINNKK